MGSKDLLESFARRKPNGALGILGIVRWSPDARVGQLVWSPSEPPALEKG
jgi:hypothetical protein